MNNPKRKKDRDSRIPRKISPGTRPVYREEETQPEDIPLTATDDTAAEKWISISGTDDNTATGKVPIVIENAVSGDGGQVIKTIKMEITLSDESTIQKEIVISGMEPKTEVSRDVSHGVSRDVSREDTKIPRATVAVLAFIICASLVSGIYHWYTTYYKPADAVEPAYVGAGTVADQQQPDDSAAEQTLEPATTPPPADPEDPAETVTPAGPRYDFDPLPEFVSLQEEYGNEDIVAILTLGEAEILVVQGADNIYYITHDIDREYSSRGWVFLDHEIDLFMGMEHNMVIYDPVGGFLREAIQEYANYDFFLKNPMITFSTLFGEIEWEIFSYYIAPADFPFAVVNHPNDDAWGEMVEQFTLASLYNTRLDVTMYDQVLTIVVPTNINPELFYILQARMLRQITS